jgi:hypothetical protein
MRVIPRGKTGGPANAANDLNEWCFPRSRGFTTDSSMAIASSSIASGFGTDLCGPRTYDVSVHQPDARPGWSMMAHIVPVGVPDIDR